jgi:hypothetical protein
VSTTSYSGAGNNGAAERSHRRVLRDAIVFVHHDGALLPSLHGGEGTFESKATRTNLLELYTSEGCSSCPPAEAWLSKLKDDPRLWNEFVPGRFPRRLLGSLGWRDPFASKQWTARQYEYSARWKSSSVYTPGFVLNGREWRNSGVPAASNEKPGVLKLTVTDGDVVKATFSPEAGEARKFDLHVARLGSDLRINVKAGENSGGNCCTISWFSRS